MHPHNQANRGLCQLMLDMREDHRGECVCRGIGLGVCPVGLYLTRQPMKAVKLCATWLQAVAEKPSHSGVL